MHEVSVMAELISAILKELERYNVISVKEVSLTVGRLTNLGAEQLEFAYEVMSKDSVLEGSKLVIQEEDIMVKCEACGYEGPVKDLEMGEEAHIRVPILSCPECGGSVNIMAGRSCCVRSVDIEEAA